MSKVEPATSQNGTSSSKVGDNNPEAEKAFKHLTAANKLHPKEPSLVGLTDK
jgi:hypothetical protein